MNKPPYDVKNTRVNTLGSQIKTFIFNVFRYDIIQEADGDKRAIILDNLRPGTRYRVHVSAVTPYGRSNHSDVVLFDTDNPSK